MNFKLGQINVLWIDDQHENYKLGDLATDRNIILDPYKSRESGINAFSDKPSKYDAILLDACILNKENDRSETAHSKYSLEVIYEIRKVDQFLPIFVLSGNPKGVVEDNYDTTLKVLLGESYYKKYKDEEFVLDRLKETVENLSKHRFKSEYPNIYKLIDQKILDNISFNRLAVFNDLVSRNSDLEFEVTDIRKMIEDLLSYLCNINYLPKDLNGEIGWVNECRKYLDGSIQSENVLINKLQGTFLRTLIFYTNDGSHKGGSKLGLDKYLESSTNNLISKSFIYLLFDVLNYFGDNIEQIQNHKNNWSNSKDNYTKKKVKVNNINTEKGYANCLSEEGENISIPDWVDPDNWKKLKPNQDIVTEGYFEKGKWMTEKIISINDNNL